MCKVSYIHHKGLTNFNGEWNPPPALWSPENASFNRVKKVLFPEQLSTAASNCNGFLTIFMCNLFDKDWPKTLRPANTVAKIIIMKDMSSVCFKQPKLSRLNNSKRPLTRPITLFLWTLKLLIYIYWFPLT